MLNIQQPAPLSLMQFMSSLHDILGYQVEVNHTGACACLHETYGPALRGNEHEPWQVSTSISTSSFPAAAVFREAFSARALLIFIAQQDAGVLP